MKAETVEALIRRRLRATYAIVLLESLWAALWPLAALALGALALAFSDVLTRLPGALHSGLLALAAIITLVLAVHGARRLRLPTAETVRRRLEQANGLDHGPLATLLDRPAWIGNPATGRLWQMHLARLRAQLPVLRLPRLRPMLAARDPYGLTALAGLMLVVAAVGGRGDLGARLLRALTPALAHSGPVELALWITPPETTGEQPVALRVTADAPPRLVVPAGSRLVGGVSANRLPRLVTPDGSLRAEGGAAGYRFDVPLISGGMYRLQVAGRPVAAWELVLRPDAPPEAAFPAALGATGSGALAVPYQIRDDYGLRDAALEIAAAGSPMTLPITIRPGREVADTAFFDLADHPWAGLTVTARLRATDSAGQEGRSETVTTRLPARSFSHPVAQQLIEIRRRLAADPRYRGQAAAALAAIAANPDAFDGQAGVALGLGAARARLRLPPQGPRLQGTLRLLWDMAMALEQGDLYAARQALAAAEQALRQALNDPNVGEAEIEELLAQFDRALRRYLTALAERRGDGEGLPRDLLPDGLAQIDISAMIAELQALSRTGAREAARAMLDQLRDLLEGLSSDPRDDALQAMADLLRRLNDLDALARDQQQLLDDTLRRANSRLEAGPEVGLGRRQGDLTARLEAVLREGGEGFARLDPRLPGQFDAARRGMGQAEETLRRFGAAPALDAQSEALDRLQTATQALRDGITQALGSAIRVGNDAGGMGRDPLGRPQLGDGGGVRIPERDALDRAWRVLQELRRRAGQTDRPQLEREYIDRLLDRF